MVRFLILPVFYLFRSHLCLCVQLPRHGSRSQLVAGVRAGTGGAHARWSCAGTGERNAAGSVKTEEDEGKRERSKERRREERREKRWSTSS